MIFCSCPTRMSDKNADSGKCARRKAKKKDCTPTHVVYNRVMGSDFLALSALADELDAKLKGARMDKIVQPEADEIRLHLRAGGKTVCLVASCNAGAPRLHITSERKQNPVTAPGFCMLLRKYLSVSAVEEVGMWQNDRIIFLRFTARTEMRDNAEFYLFIEIMNRYSNIVFTSSDLVILDAVKHLGFDDGGGHVVLRGVRYAPPEQPKPNYRTEEGKRALHDFPGGDLHRFILDKMSGFSGATVAEILRRAELPADLPRPLSEEEKERLGTLLDALGDVTHAPFYAPCVIGKEVYPFPYAAAKGERRDFPDIVSAYDALYTAADRDLRNKARLKALSTAVKHLRSRTEKNIAIDRERLKECENMDKWRVMGELIVTNIYRIKRGDKVLKCTDYYTGEEREIPLDERLTPSGNSTAYFNRYNKLKRTKEFTEKKLAADLLLLDYVASLEEEIASLPYDAPSTAIEEELERLGAVRKKSKGKVRREKAEPPAEYVVGGFTVLAGKNNLQNDELTFRVASSSDLWLHLKNRHGAHVVVLTEGKTVPEEVIKVAAEIAAASAGANAEVDYTLRRYVKRRPSGHPGQVIYTDFKTTVARPDAHPELLKRKNAD